MALRDSDVLLEFYHVGHYVKVSAVDPVSRIEVSIVGDPTRGRRALEDAAIRKLRYVIEKQAGRKP